MILEWANRKTVVVVPDVCLSQVMEEAVSSLERARKDALRVDGTILQAAARAYVNVAKRLAHDLAQKLPTT